MTHRLEQRQVRVDRHGDGDRAVDRRDHPALCAHPDELEAGPCLEPGEADRPPHRANADRGEHTEHAHGVDVAHAAGAMSVAAHEDAWQHGRHRQHGLRDQQPAEPCEPRIGRTAMDRCVVARHEVHELTIREEPPDDHRPRDQHPAQRAHDDESEHADRRRHHEQEQRTATAERGDDTEVCIAIRELDRAIDRGGLQPGDAGVDVDDRAHHEEDQAQCHDHRRTLLQGLTWELEHHEQDRTGTDHAA